MSSLSMNKVRGRALNANTQNTNNFSMWMDPLSHKQYPVTDVGNPTNNAVITSNGTRDTITAQPGLLYNTVRLDVSGSVNPTKWTVGQTINTVFLAGNDPLLNQTDASSVGISSGRVASYTYTPRSSNSKIIVEYEALYDIVGFNGDTYSSFIYVNDTSGGNQIAKKIQRFTSQVGGGTRSGTIFPIMGAYNNSGLSNMTFNIMLTSSSQDGDGSGPGDPINFYRTVFDSCMRVTEISL